MQVGAFFFVCFGVGFVGFVVTIFGFWYLYLFVISVFVSWVLVVCVCCYVSLFAWLVGWLLG